MVDGWTLKHAYNFILYHVINIDLKDLERIKFWLVMIKMKYIMEMCFLLKVDM